MLKTKIEEKDGRVVVTPVGELETSVCDSFQEEMAQFTRREGLKMELDLGSLEYISSKGLRVLISMQKAISDNGGSMVVTEVTDVVREVFDMTGLTRSFLVE